MKRTQLNRTAFPRNMNARKHEPLYRCPACGHEASDDQADPKGHVEQGGCTIEGDDGWPEKGYSYWLLACAKCGEINNMQAVPVPKRKPIPRVAKRKVKTVRAANAARAEFAETFDKCMNCGRRGLLVAHEIVRGAGRFKGIQEPLVQLVLCSTRPWECAPGCHERLHHEAWSIVRQVAIRALRLPEEAEASRAKVNELRGRAPDAVSAEEVQRALEELA